MARTRWFAPRMKNLALQRPYTIGAQWPDALFHSTEQSQYPDRGQLTAGRTASLNAKDPAWIALLRQYGRSVTVDLGAAHHLSSVELRFFQNLRAGIQFPPSVSFYTSLDRTAWHLAGRDFIRFSDYQDSMAARTFKAEIDHLARYVRVQFTTQVYAFLSELAVNGRTHTADGTPPPAASALTAITGDDYLWDPLDPEGDGFSLRHIPQRAQDMAPESGAQIGSVQPDAHRDHGSSAHKDDEAHAHRGDTADPARRNGDGPTPAKEGYLTAPDAASGGINHLMLVYTGSKDALGTWTPHDFLPMVAQMDEKGEPIHWLFDGALFCPHGKLPHTAAAWTAWLDDLFSPGVQLAALNQTVAQIKRKLPDDRFTVGVVLTLPAMMAPPADFGSFSENGPGLVMDPALAGHEQAALNKLQAIRHVMKEALRRFRESDFPHLRLAGFYWRAESLNMNDPYDPWLIRRTADDIHAHDLHFYWIPFYGASGIPFARQLGLDAVFIQPGVSFHWEVAAVDRLRAAAELARHHHMGVEIELHWDILNAANPERAATALAKYREYFAAAKRHGFDGHAAKAYYLNSKTLVACSRAADAVQREAYQVTASFIMGL